MAHIQDRGKDHQRRWQARFRDPGGRERSKALRGKWTPKMARPGDSGPRDRPLRRPQSGERHPR